MTSDLDAYLADDDARSLMAREPSPNPERPDESLLAWVEWQRKHGRSLGQTLALRAIRRVICAG